MSAIVRVSILLVVLVCALPGVVTGQERNGFWIEFDVGRGSAGNSSHGLGFTTGTGYDVYLGRGFWLMPAVNFWYGQAGDVVFSRDAVIRDWTHNQIDFTVGIKFN